MNDDNADDDSIVTSISSTGNKKLRKRKGMVENSAIGLNDVMLSIKNLCENSTPVASNTSPKKQKGIENMTLDELYKLVEQYKRQIQFLKEMDSLSESEKDLIVGETKCIFEEINKRTSSEVS